MQMQIVYLRDIVANLTTQPQFVANIPSWLRALQTAINDGANKELEFVRHPGDFEAWHVGTYDDNSGEFTIFPLKERKQLAALGNFKLPQN